MKRSASIEPNNPKRPHVIDLTEDDEAPRPPPHRSWWTQHDHASSSTLTQQMEELGCVTWHVTPLFHVASADAPTSPVGSSSIHQFLRHHECDDRAHEHILRALEARYPTLQVDFTVVDESHSRDDGTRRKTVLVRVSVDVLHLDRLHLREGNYDRYMALLDFLVMLCDRRESRTCPQFPLGA